MPGKFTLENTLEKLNAHLKSRGATGIKGLGRAFRIVDKDHSKELNREEFKEAMRIWKMDINEAETSILVAHFDEDGDGQISYDEFLMGVRGKLSERRLNLVKKAFVVLDVDGSGVITVEDIAASYDASQHPEVMAGKKEPKEVFSEFMNNFEGANGNHDGTVTLDEFIHYYEGVSASIDEDDFFVLMMSNAWKVVEHPGEVVLGDDRIDSLCKSLRQKLMQKKKGSETESKALVKAFQYFNLSGNNMVDCRCFARTVERFGVVLEAAEMEGWFSHYDPEKTGQINYEEFTAALYPDDNVRVRASGVSTTPGKKGMDSSDVSSKAEWRPSTAKVKPAQATALW